MFTGIPYYIYSGGSLREFDITMDTGVVRAYLDPSNQYSADGPTWRRAENRQSIPSHRVKGFDVIDGKPAFPLKS